MTEAKSAAGLIDHVLRKHEFYSQAECADIPDTIGADLIAALLSYAAERERAFEDLQADYGNDLGYLKALKESARQLRDLFAEHGVDKHLNWPEWFAAIESRLRSHPATEGKREDD